MNRWQIMKVVGDGNVVGDGRRKIEFGVNDWRGAFASVLLCGIASERLFDLSDGAINFAGQNGIPGRRSRTVGVYG